MLFNIYVCGVPMCMSVLGAVCVYLYVYAMHACIYMHVCGCKLTGLNFNTTFAKVSHLVLSKVYYQPGPWSW